VPEGAFVATVFVSVRADCDNGIAALQSLTRY